MTAFDASGTRFRDVVAALGDEEAEFLLIGAFGGTSSEQSSGNADGDGDGDVDILVRPAIDNAARVWRALQRSGLPADAAGLSENELASPGVVHAIAEPPHSFHLITDLNGVTFEQAWQSRVVVDWNGRRVGVLGHGASLASRPAARTNGFPAADEPEQRDPTNNT